MIFCLRNAWRLIIYQFAFSAKPFLRNFHVAYEVQIEPKSLANF